MADRSRRTMGLEGGHAALSEEAIERALNCYGPSHFAGRLLATIETRDAEIAGLKARVKELEAENKDLGEELSASYVDFDECERALDSANAVLGSVEI